MSDYIKREDVINAIEKYRWPDDMIDTMADNVIGDIEDIPAADVVERKQWIPVTERLPEIGRKVLVYAYGQEILTARMNKRTENGYPVFECNGIFLEMAKPGRISHWMPLPQPPESEGE